MQIGDLFLKILADGSELTPSVQKAAAKAGDAGGKTLGQKLSHSLGISAGVSAAVTTKALGLVGEAVGEVTGLIEGSVHAYQDHEVAAAKLTTSLNANVTGWQANSRAIQDATEASVRLGFTNTETTDSLAKLVAATHDVGKATELLGAAQDLARFKGISLADATEALTKVEGGSFRILRSLGINLKAGATQTEALAAVMKVAGGQAQAFAGTDLGKVEVASAKVEEAQVKLGKGLSKLESAVLPAAADAVSSFADVVDGLTTSMDKNASTQDKLRAGAAGLQSGWLQLLPGGAALSGLQGDLADKMNAAADAEDAAAAAAATHGDALDGVRSSVRGLTDAEVDAHRPATQTAEDLGKIARVADIAHAAIDPLTNAIADELFGKAITAGHIQELKDANKELEKQRSQVKQNSPKWIELTGQIAQNNAELFKYQLQQADAKGPKAAIKFLDDEITKFGDADGSIRRLIVQYKALSAAQGALLRQLTRVAGGRFAGKPIPLFAAGGQYQANQPRIVGENGPELDIPDHSGFIVPGVHLTPPLAVAGTASVRGVGLTGAGAAPSTTNVTLVMPDARNRDPFEALERARRYAGFGAFSGRPFPPAAPAPR